MRYQLLEDWLAWQEHSHPVEIDLGLERVGQVLTNMALRESDALVISVAGTNGKGSCVAMLESILTQAGLSVGSYTSPHLLTYNERIRIDGKSATDKDICDAFEYIDNARGDISLSYFEFGTLAAIYLFRQENVDIALYEVGLGGRLDAVNILDADIAVITSVDIDHVAWLGSDRGTIAVEKAGIFRKRKIAVCGDLDIPPSIVDKADALGTTLYQINQDFRYEIQCSGAPGNQKSWRWESGLRMFDNLPIPGLVGDFQLTNAATVLMVITLISDGFDISDRHVVDGLKSVSLSGRFQRVGTSPEVIVDVAHNPKSVQLLANTLAEIPCKGVTIAVFAVMADKDIEGILETLINKIDSWYIADLDTERAASAADVRKKLDNLQVANPVVAFKSVRDAYQQALSDAEPNDRIIAFGSFFTVAEVLQLSTDTGFVD
ncbi:MAG: bifunctional tetrahydrofolate synthase/dihydrofolate synthase [Gammaproteobacteria bacterium]